MQKNSDLNPELIAEVAHLIKGATAVIVLTGAGVSAESGIPTFREAQTGIWAQYEAEKLATPEGFQNDPALVWRWYNWRRQLVAQAKPNPGHRALAKLEQLVEKFTLLTQNVDGFHLLAGSKNVVELHGTLNRFKCFNYGHPCADNIPPDLEYPPKCDCESLIRPDIVWFGEQLNPQHLATADQACRQCDVFIVIGTSGLVQPAASFPFVAKRCGAKVIELNMDKTQITTIADKFVQGPSGQSLPAILAVLEQ